MTYSNTTSASLSTHSAFSSRSVSFSNTTVTFYTLSPFYGSDNLEVNYSVDGEYDSDIVSPNTQASADDFD